MQVAEMDTVTHIFHQQAHMWTWREAVRYFTIAKSIKKKNTKVQQEHVKPPLWLDMVQIWSISIIQQRNVLNLMNQRGIWKRSVLCATWEECTARPRTSPSVTNVFISQYSTQNTRFEYTIQSKLNCTDLCRIYFLRPGRVSSELF